VKLKKPSRIVGIIILLAIVCLSIGIIVSLHHSSTTAPKASIVAPSYQTILPKGKTITELGGWARVSPTDSTPVYAYIDTIETVSVSVSEQPLPSSFKNNTSDQVATLAKAYNASDKLSADGTEVYIGTSAKGPQSVIFTKKNLLILIKSEKEINNTAWSTYVTSLD
jgi:hypothetical protein